MLFYAGSHDCETNGKLQIYFSLLVTSIVDFLSVVKVVVVVAVVKVVVVCEIQQQRVDHAIQILQGGYDHARWVFLLKGQIDGQIGSLHYMQKQFDKAQPMLEKAWSRHWLAKGMLAADGIRRAGKAIPDSGIRYPRIQAVRKRCRTQGR